MIKKADRVIGECIKTIYDDIIIAKYLLLKPDALFEVIVSVDGTMKNKSYISSEWSRVYPMSSFAKNLYPVNYTTAIKALFTGKWKKKK